MNLLDRIKNRQALVAVIGLGYVGLPLAVEYARQGYQVTGIDTNTERIKQLRAGASYIMDVSSQEVEQVIKSRRFTPTTDYSQLKEVDAISICVPTPLRKTKDPDISYITAVIERIKKHMHRDILIILESTTYPGTTEELVCSEIESLGYRVGQDFFVAFSPERVDPGNDLYKTNNTPKVIGGLTPRCTELAEALYSSVVNQVVTVSSPRVAEMVKLLENTFRSVNIALVNEMALLCNRMNIDIWEVIQAAATKPFGFMPFYPGPGTGGHCIPLDPMYLSWKAKDYDFYHRFIELACDINGNMPRYLVSRISDTLNKCRKCLNGARILLLGMAYKKDVNDIRESPALELYYLLESSGAQVDFHDDLVGRFVHKNEAVIESTPISAEILRTYDLAVLTTNHSYFDYEMIARNTRVIFDSRNGFKNHPSPNIVKL